MRLRLSLRARLTLLFALGACAVLLVLGWSTGVEIERHFEHLDRNTLQDKLQQVAKLVQASPATPAQALQATLENALLGHHDLVVLVRDAQGRTLLRSPGVEFAPELLHPPPAPALTPLVYWSHAGVPLRGLAQRMARPGPGAAALDVALAVNTGHHQMFLHNLMRSLWWFVGLGAVAMGVLGWLAARQGLAPLRAMREQAASVTAQQLDRRIPVEAVPPELEQLALSLNAMLARLEDAFTRLSDFSSDLAHELRTPLSNLLTQTQVALARPRDAQVYRETLESVVEECERLSRMIDSMLFLAKAEYGQVTQWVQEQARAVDLRQQVQDLFDFYEALAEDRQVTLHLSGQGSVAGDALMLRRALSNLLSNAIKYSAPGAQVQVDIQADARGCTLQVRNPGTVPEAQLARVFERFYRADPARRSHGAGPGEGAGLGLAITRAIVQAHRGSIEAHCAEGHTVFTVHWPAPGGAGS
ncbi:MAG: heavy metal sensor histidine kinase [Rhodoferax sp.]